MLYFCRYACVPENWDDFQNEDIYVKSFTGTHFITGEETDQDVDMIFFERGTMFSIPEGIGAAFRNLKSFHMQYFLKTKRITRSSFEHMFKLVEIVFFKIEIDELNFDAMWDLPALEIFVVVQSKLKILHEKTFEKNERLKYVHLNSNLLEFLPRNIFKNNLKLEQVHLSKNSLRFIEIDFTALKNIRLFDLRDNTCTGAYHNVEVNETVRLFDDVVQKFSEFELITVFGNTRSGVYYNSEVRVRFDYVVPFENFSEFEQLVRNNCSSIFQHLNGK